MSIYQKIYKVKFVTPVSLHCALLRGHDSLQRVKCVIFGPKCYQVVLAGLIDVYSIALH